METECETGRTSVCLNSKQKESEWWRQKQTDRETGGQLENESKLKRWQVHFQLSVCLSQWDESLHLRTWRRTPSLHLHHTEQVSLKMWFITTWLTLLNAGFWLVLTLSDSETIKLFLNSLLVFLGLMNSEIIIQGPRRSVPEAAGRRAQRQEDEAALGPSAGFRKVGQQLVSESGWTEGLHGGPEKDKYGCFFELWIMQSYSSAVPE